MAGNKDFGKHLKKLREAKGFSQEKLAELVKLEYQTISRIETGLYFTSFENLKKIAEALELSMKDLFDFPEAELSKSQILKQIICEIKPLDVQTLINIHKIICLYNQNRK